MNMSVMIRPLVGRIRNVLKIQILHVSVRFIFHDFGFVEADYFMVNNLIPVAI